MSGWKVPETRIKKMYFFLYEDASSTFHIRTSKMEKIYIYIFSVEVRTTFGETRDFIRLRRRKSRFLYVLYANHGGRGSHTKLSRRVFLKQVNNITPSGNVINVRRRGCAANAFELEAKILILRRP
jgi:hypothetical protein